MHNPSAAWTTNVYSLDTRQRYSLDLREVLARPALFRLPTVDEVRGLFRTSVKQGERLPQLNEYNERSTL
jgi:hypothetical protein